MRDPFIVLEPLLSTIQSLAILGRERFIVLGIENPLDQRLDGWQLVRS